jgi:hypothetical protein
VVSRSTTLVEFKTLPTTTSLSAPRQRFIKRWEVLPAHFILRNVSTLRGQSRVDGVHCVSPLDCRKVCFIEKHGQNSKLVYFCLRSDWIKHVNSAIWDTMWACRVQKGKELNDFQWNMHYESNEQCLGVVSAEGKGTEWFPEKSLILESSLKSEVRFASSKETLHLRR